MKKRAMRVELEGWLYLQDQSSLQRGGRIHSESWRERMKKHYEWHDKKYGGHMLMDGDLGGAIGKPENSYEEGRWTSWSLDQMKKMLDEKGYKYIDIEDVDVINAIGLGI